MALDTDTSDDSIQNQVDARDMSGQYMSYNDAHLGNLVYYSGYLASQTPYQIQGIFISLRQMYFCRKNSSDQSVIDSNYLHSLPA